MSIIVHSNWSTTLINDVIRVQIVVIYSHVGSGAVDVMSLSSVVCLPKLIENWSGSFCINCWYLSHNLSVVCMRTVSEFSTSSLFSWTNFLRRSALGSVSMIPVLALARFIWWWVTTSWVALIAILLVVSNSVSSEHISMELQSISVTCVKSISSKLFHFTVSHLFGFFNLSRI